MKKIFIIIIITFLCIVLLGYSQNRSDGIPLKEYTQSFSEVKMKELAINEHINELFLLPEDDFNELDVAHIITNILRLPPSLLLKIQQSGIRIKLFTGKLTDNLSAQHLKGMVPRGYSNKKKWDDVPGIGGGKTVLVKIGYSERGMGHSSINLELHELAHSIDNVVYHHLRTDPSFLNIWKEERLNLFPTRTYLLSFPEEYFAECFALYYFNDESNALLASKAPKTYQYIKHIQ